MSAARLDALTNELFENMAECLDLDDLRNLRLVSRAVAFKTTQNHFESYFSRKQVNISGQGLQAFAQATSQGNRLACLVRHLTLTGIDYSTSIQILEKTMGSGYVTYDTAIGMRYPPRHWKCSREELRAVQTSLDELKRCKADDDMFHKEGLDVYLLSAALRNVASHRRHNIVKLRLRQVLRLGNFATRKPNGVLHVRDRHSGFRSAAKTFAVLASAMRDGARAPTVQHLDIYRGDPAKSWCSVPHDTFWPIRLGDLGFLADSEHGDEVVDARVGSLHRDSGPRIDKVGQK